MTERHEVVVIGGGIVGVSTALHLQMRGVKVALLDRGDAELATSFGNSGIIEASYVLPFSLPAKKRFPKIALNLDAAVHFHYLDMPKYVAWIMDFYAKSQPDPRRINGRLLRPLITPAIEEHRNLMLHTDAEKYVTKAGRVKLHRSEASFASSAMERDVARELGVPFEVMTPDQFAEIEPDLKPAYAKAVRWTSSIRLTNPGAVVAAYLQRFVAEGGKVLTTEAKALHDRGQDGWRLTTTSQDIDAQQVVVCTGPWTGELLEPMRYHFPLGIKRGYHQHFAATGSAKLSHAIVDADIGYLICPMEKGYRLTSGAEFADLHANATPVQIEQILPYARELFAIGEPVEAKAWLGSRPCFTDSLPVIGPAPRHKGLWFNFGHGHSGLTIGPPSGRLLAEMLRGEKTFCDPHPYRAARFNG